jgi:hypothetical protein
LRFTAAQATRWAALSRAGPRDASGGGARESKRINHLSGADALGAGLMSIKSMNAQQ